MPFDMKAAIGRVQAFWPDDVNPVLGTGFVVARRYVMTAFHVVGDRAAFVRDKELRLAPQIRFLLSGLAVQGHVPSGCSDASQDWAVIELDEPLPAHIPQLALGSAAVLAGPGPWQFHCWGIPVDGEAQLGGGQMFDGRILDTCARYQGAAALELYSDSAAAGIAALLNGLSGAPCVVSGAVVGVIRSNLVTRDPITGAAVISRGKLYACPIDAGSLVAACGQRIPLPDPICGLPGLPVLPLPSQPFRHLHWYGKEHAELFFGRGADVRALFDCVTSVDAPAVTLLYGSSGVGKSSLLEAGLYPRLAERMRVTVQRRRAQGTLSDTVREMASAGGSSALPHLLVLDQIEGVFAVGEAEGVGELQALAETIAELAEAAGPPRVLLVFRREWLAQFRTALSTSGLKCAEYYLRPMGVAGVQEVVDGIASTPRLRQHYRVDVANELAAKIAGWLLRDSKSPVSPMLSILMTRLYAMAKAEEAPWKMRVEHFEELVRGRLDLGQFLLEQVAKCEAAYPDEGQSGLVLDLLAIHAGEYGGTSDIRLADLESRYRHVYGSSPDRLRALISELQSLSLLHVTSERNQDGREDSISRLAHDTLAPHVKELFATSQKPGQRAWRCLESFRIRGSDLDLLDEPSISLIESGRNGMRGLLDTQEKEVARARSNIEERRHRALLAARMGRVLRFGLIIASIVLVVTTSVSFREYLRNEALALASRGVDLVEARRPDLGLPLALAAHRMSPNSATRDALLSISTQTRSLVAVDRRVGAGELNWTDHFSALSRDASLAAFVTGPGSVTILDTRSGESTEVRSELARVGESSIALSAQGECVAIADGHGRLGIHAVGRSPCRLETREPLTSATPISSMVMAPSRSEVYAGTSDGTLRRWRREGDTWTSADSVLLHGPSQKTGAITHLVASSDESVIAAGSVRGDVWAGSGQDLKDIKSLSADAWPFKTNGLAMDRTGRFVLTLRDNDAARVWDLKQFAQIFEIKTQSSPSSAAFSPDGRFVAIGFWNGEAGLWEVQSGLRAARYARHAGGVLRTAFNAAGTEVKTWSIDGLLQTSTTLGSPIFSAGGGRLAGVVVDPSGRQFSVRVVPPLFRRWLFDESGWSPAAGRSDARVVEWGAIRPHCVADEDVQRLSSKLPSELNDGDLYDISNQCGMVAAASTREKVIFGAGLRSKVSWRTLPSAYGAKAVRFSPDGRWFVAAEDNYVVFFDSMTGERIGPRFTTGTAELVLKLALDEKGQYVFAASNAEIAVWPTPDTAIQMMSKVRTPRMSEDELRNYVPSGFIRWWLRAVYL